MFAGQGEVGEARAVREGDDALHGPVPVRNADHAVILETNGFNLIGGKTAVGINRCPLASVCAEHTRLNLSCLPALGMAVKTKLSVFQIEQIPLPDRILMNPGIQCIEQNQRGQAFLTGKFRIGFAEQADTGNLFSDLKANGAVTINVFAVQSVDECFIVFLRFLPQLIFRVLIQQPKHDFGIDRVKL